MIYFNATSAAESGNYEWLDDLHTTLSDSVTESARWFDSFFVENDAVQSTAWGEARLRMGWEPRSRELNQFESRLRIRVKLPNLKDKVDLVFSDYDESEPQAPVKSARNARFDDEEQFNLALRWRANPNSGWSHRIGTGRRLQFYYRLRYRTHFEFSKQSNLRTEASLEYYNRDRLGATMLASLDHQFTPHSIFRFNNKFYFRDKSKDWLWQHSIQHLHQFRDKSAIISGIYWEGSSRPNYQLQEYLISARWRQNILRKWLFYEVEPFILWRRDENFSASYGVALRLEGYFGKG